MKDQMDELLVKLSRPSFDTDDKSGAEELKAFNLQMKSEHRAAGKTAPDDFDAKQYAAYKSGFNALIRGIKYEHLDSMQQKALQAGSDPDGGYLLPAAVSGRVISKVYENL